MAIQNRRGQYTDFDPAKMVAGELAVVQSGDPNTSDGKAVYVAFQSGTSKRLATYDDIPSGSGTGLTQTEKNLILELFSKAAYAEDDAGTAYEELEQLWSGLATYSVTWSGSGYSKSNSATRVSEGESFTSTVTVNNGFTLDGVTVTMGGNTVTGAWSNGTVTIPSVTGNVVITVATTQVTVSSISAVYTQSGTVYDTDTLDSLKADLVVTATFMDSSTGVISANDYTLSGTLTEGTSTVTVTYGGKTATFSVTVTHWKPITEQITWSGTGTDSTSSIIDATERDVYFSVPFISGATELQTTAVAGGNAYKARSAMLYSDAEANTLVGYYFFDTEQIESTQRTTANAPWLNFDTEYLVIPKGYYATLIMAKSGSQTFVDNASSRTYLNTYGNTVELR